jgi:hypothetical protein
MTDEELKALVASLAIDRLEMRELQQSQQREMEEQFNKRQQALEEQELKRQQALEEQEHKRQQEKEELKREDEQRKKEFDQMIKELSQQIGGLGEKWGGFTEGLALPSMQKILREKFNMEVISPSVRVSKQGQNMEIDVLAYANSDINEAYVVEVKSHAREEAIQQLRKILERFRQFFPEHKDKTVYGILAAVDMSAELRERILKAGFYVARIHDQVFELDVPANFKPKAY